MNHPAVVAHYLDRLRAPAWRPPAQAARMLAPAAAQPVVWESLVAAARADDNLAVRIQALRAAAASGRAETLPILEEALARGPEPLQEHALSALAEWGVAAGREEEAAIRLLKETAGGDGDGELRRRGIALYALGELEAPGVDGVLDRFLRADDRATAGGAWGSLAYRKRRDQLPVILQSAGEARDEWVHDQALKTARLLTDVQSRYYRLPFPSRPDWMKGLGAAFPEPLRGRAEQLLGRLAGTWGAGAYRDALTEMEGLVSLLLTGLGREHGRWEGPPTTRAPEPWLRGTDELAWARLTFIRWLARDPAFPAGRFRRWVKEELKAAIAAFLETFDRAPRLARSWSGRDPAEATTDPGRRVWALDADQERAPYALLVRLRRLGREVLPALRAFVADSMVVHGRPWALGLLGEVGQEEELSLLLELACHPTLGETAQAAAARFGPAAVARVLPWLQADDPAASAAAVGVLSRVPLAQSWLTLGELLNRSDGPLFQAAVAGLVRLGGRPALERLGAAGQTLAGERGFLARRAALYLAGWEEEAPGFLSGWRDVPLLGPLPEPASVGVHEFDVYTEPDHEAPPDPEDRFPDRLPLLEPKGP